MAVKSKKGNDVGTSAEDMLDLYKSNFGEGVGSVGASFTDVERVPTGLFTLDLAIGGGLPKGKCTTIFGPESSAKTAIALLSIAQHQKLWPDQKNIFFDIENAFDKVWASALGVDVSKLIVLKPSYGEQMVDMVEGFLYADDCGMVVIDSIAAIIATTEVENSAEKHSYGGNSQLIGKLVRKTTLALNEREKKLSTDGTPLPTLVYINQLRTKLGVMFGSNETLPGGNAPKYQNALLLRLYGKNIVDEKVSSILPVRKHIDFIVKKWKMPIVATNGTMELVTVPHKGFSIGQLDDWNTVVHYLKLYEQFGKAENKKSGWVILGEEYPTQSKFRERLYGDNIFGGDVREAIIKRTMEESNVLKPVSHTSETDV